jgi:hypothetical protein
MNWKSSICAWNCISCCPFLCLICPFAFSCELAHQLPHNSTARIAHAAA